jgi:hypothetical protein
VIGGERWGVVARRVVPVLGQEWQGQGQGHEPEGVVKFERSLLTPNDEESRSRVTC